jgi:hypothetical protein
MKLESQDSTTMFLHRIADLEAQLATATAALEVAEKQAKNWDYKVGMEHWKFSYDKVRERAMKAESALAEAENLLRRLQQWDHMQSAADGPYWLSEIAKVVGVVK